MKSKIIKFLTSFAILGTKFGFDKILFVKYIYGKLVSYFGNSNEIELVKTNLGIEMYINKSGLVVEKAIKDHGVWEQEITDLIKDKLQKGDVFVDVGANIGWFTLLASQIVGDNGKVFAFEPSKYNFNILQKNLFLNKINNVKAFKKGLGSKNKNEIIHYVPNNPGHSSILEDDRNIFFDKEEIQIVSMDIILSEIDKIDLIKIDVEGYEYEVFLGMQKIIKKYHPTIILEYTPNFYKSLYKQSDQFNIDFLQKILDYGYEIFHINEYSLQLDLYGKSPIVQIQKEDIKAYLRDRIQSNLLLRYKK